jgi:uncharacterized protein
MTSIVEIYSDEIGNYRFRFMDGDRGVIAVSAEGYADKAGARNGAHGTQRHLADNRKIDIHRLRSGGYGFRLVAANNETIAVNGESYKDAVTAKNAIERLRHIAESATMVDLTD